MLAIRHTGHLASHVAALVLAIAILLLSLSLCLSVCLPSSILPFFPPSSRFLIFTNFDSDLYLYLDLDLCLDLCLAWQPHKTVPSVQPRRGQEDFIPEPVAAPAPHRDE